MSTFQHKYFLFVFAVLIFTSCAVRYQSGRLILKDGSIKYGLIKSDDSYLMFKKYSSDEAKKFHYTEVDYVKKPNNMNEIRKFKYLKVLNGRFRLLEEVIAGPISLYINTETYNSDPFGPNMGMVQHTTVTYYVRRKNDRHALLISSNQVFINKLKANGPMFFKDCPELVKKIENKDFKKREIKKVVHFYNDHCA